MQSAPPKNKLKVKALLSFIIFILIIAKDILVYYNVIPVYSLLNRHISYFVILPLWVIGMILSVWTLGELFWVSRQLKKVIRDLNFWLVLPILLDTLYFFIRLAYILIIAET